LCGTGHVASVARTNIIIVAGSPAHRQWDDVFDGSTAIDLPTPAARLRPYTIAPILLAIECAFPKELLPTEIRLLLGFSAFQRWLRLGELHNRAWLQAF
jgi:hypothetical protein